MQTVIEPADIPALEASLGHPLPDAYRDLLTSFGFGRLDDGRTVYHPSEIADLYSHHFEGDDDLFNCYFPIGCDESEQTIWLVDVASGNVATIYHDTHPDDYPDEDWMVQRQWRSLERSV